MTLRVEKETRMTGFSTIENVTVATFQANVRTDAADFSQDTITTTINNPELYAQNRVEVRKDTAAFNETVYEIQDAYIEEAEKNAKA